MRFQITEVDECLITVLETHGELIEMFMLSEDFPFVMTKPETVTKDGYTTMRFYEVEGMTAFHEDALNGLDEFNIPFEYQKFTPNIIYVTHRFYQGASLEYEHHSVEAPVYTIDAVMRARDSAPHLKELVDTYTSILNAREEADLYEAGFQLSQWQLTQVDKLLQN